MDSQGYECDDGVWNGEAGVTCEDRCVRIPKAPANGRVDCVGKVIFYQLIIDTWYLVGLLNLCDFISQVAFSK